MDKSSSDQCQHFDDGSWDLEDEEEIAKPLESPSSNSWDASSDEEKRETRVEAFEKKDVDSESSISLDAKCEEILDRGEALTFDTSMRDSRHDEKWKECVLVVEDLEEPDVTEVKSVESVWRIPISLRSESSGDEVEIVQRMVLQKSKSNPNVFRTLHPLKKSKSFGDITREMNFSPKDALIQYEGGNITRVKEFDLEKIINLDETGVHFQEIQCWTLITKKDKTESEDGEQCSRSNVAASNKDETFDVQNTAGTSRNERSNHEFLNTASYTSNRNLILEKMENILTESWILLDEMGQSQPVTLTEVNFLLNGRSADAVLQENKEHFIPKSTVVRNANSDFRVDGWNPLVEESLQHFLNEDSGGEESTPTNIRLERKVGNMLLYIQSGINLTSSVRFIPVDTEMIHMWRQSKETMSPMSSEDDARLSISENIMEEASEWENPDMSDDVSCKVHKPGPSVRKRRTGQGKVDDCQNRTTENGSIIQSLTDEVKQLRMRLETERCRSSGLEQENHHLRSQLDKCKSGRSSNTSRKTKSEMSEDFGSKRNDKVRIPDISSSSLLSVEDFKDENVEEGLPRECLLADDRKNFKHDLDMQLNDIEEILKGKTLGQAKRENGKKLDNLRCIRTVGANRGISSSTSFSTYTIAETNSAVAMSETTGSTDSWFRPKKSEPGHNNIAEVINNLEKENERLVIENTNLKKKLNEISLELDEYISSCAVHIPKEDGLQAESLRNQVCNLKLELENLKSIAKNKEHGYKLKDAIVREELAEKTVSLEEWKRSIAAVYRELDENQRKLVEIGVVAPNAATGLSNPTPGNLMTILRSLTAALTEKITDFQKENSILRKSLQESIIGNSKNAVFGFEKNLDVNFVQVPGLLPGNLMREKGENYYSLISEKSVLEDEIKSLRKENDLLLEYQIKHNERLTKATASLREEKIKVESLENAAKLMEVEKGEISQALVSCQKEKTIAESSLRVEEAKMAELRGECERRRSEVKKLEIKLHDAMNKCMNVDEALCVKDAIINELKSNCSHLEERDAMHKDQVKFLTEQLKKLQDEKSDLEDELRSTKQMAKESCQGMSEYIMHLETMVNNTEENFSEMKEKCNEAIKSLNALRREYDALEKENQSNLKSWNETKKEIENSREVIRDLEENCSKCEEAKRKALCDLSTIVKSEREKTETLEKALAQRKILEEELSSLKIKAESHAKTKDRLMKEQKDFINEISILKKEKEKLAQKYRNVKNECNERTKLLRMLDGRLRDNLQEYNKRIACLEKNVSNVIERAVAYKDTFLEKRTEVRAMVRELKEQLDVAYMEKKGFEAEANNFQEAVRQLQREINENRKKTSNSLLDQEVQENERMLSEDRPIEASGSNPREEELENRLKITETEWAEAKEKIRQLEEGKEEERSKNEAIIADLKNQISRYQVRLEVMLKNITTYGKAVQEPEMEKREAKENEKVVTLEEKIRELTEELDKKKKRLLELTEVIEKNDSAMRRKEDECESLKEKILQLKEEIKNMKSQFSKLQEFLNTVNQNVETYQKERDEVAEKLAKSLQLIMEERASKKSSEAIFTEKEKMLKDQLEQLQIFQASLMEKKRDYESLLEAMDEKEVIISKLQEEVKNWKTQVSILNSEVMGLQDQRKESEGGDVLSERMAKQKSISLELKEIREQNLELRKSEGNLQAKIVRLEDELRGARLLIKELEGDLTSEKTSKKLLKEMITSAKEEIQKFKRKGQLLSSIADKIERHLNLSEVQSREFFSGYRARVD